MDHVDIVLDPADPQPPAKKPWVAGQSRPATALALCPSVLGSLGSLAMIGLFCAGYRAAMDGNPHLGTLATIAIINFAPDMLRAASEQLAIPRQRLGHVGRAAKAAWFGAARAVPKTASLATWLLLAAAGAGERAFAELSGGKGKGAATGPLAAFNKMCDSAEQRLAAKIVDMRDDSLHTLTEIGAWRAASQAIVDGDPSRAAEIWLAKPFNPDWTCSLPHRHDREADPNAPARSAAKLLGARLPFHQALARSDAAAAKAEFCQNVARRAGALKELSEIRVEVGELPSSAPRSRPARI